MRGRPWVLERLASEENLERILEMPEVQSLREHLVTELRDLLDAEQQLTKVLPDFASQASTPALRTAFAQHLRETRGQIDRLKQVFAALGERPQPKRCEGMQGLVREGNAVVRSTPEGALRDAVMITSAQKVEHYEMAAYGTARTYATVLGEPQVARLLDETLAEEKHADAKLTEIAEGKINERAAEEWHEVSAGFLAQTATMAGRAIGRISKLRGQATSSVRGAVAAASDMAGDAFSSTRSETRRRMGSGESSTRKRRSTRKAASATTRGKSKSRARGSKKS